MTLDEFEADNQVPACDLVIVDPDNPGRRFVHFYKALVQIMGPRPLIVLGSSEHFLFRIIEWDEESTTFLPKPYRLDDLKECVRSACARHRASLEPEGEDSAAEPSATSPFGAGHFEYLSLIQLFDLIQMLCLNRWDGKITVKELHSGKRGEVYLGGGGLVHAEVGEHRGERACYEMLGWGRSEFEFADRHEPVEKTIQTHWQHVLLEGARQKDEAEDVGDVGNVDGSVGQAHG